ncbi:MAG: hypothetical protein AAGF12_06600 [Myxococcota bacterium]
MSCDEPRPIRREGMPNEFADGIERIGGSGDLAWGRCERSGRWFLMLTHTGRVQVFREWELDPELATSAFCDRELDAVVQLFVKHDLPYGPAWELPQRRLELLEDMTPDASITERRRALEPLEGPIWADVRAILDWRTQRRGSPALPNYAFDLTIEHDLGAVSDVYEVGSAPAPPRLLLPSSSPRPGFQLVELSKGAAPIPLPSVPEYRCAAGASRVFSFRTDDGHGLRLFGSGGMQDVHYPRARSVVRSNGEAFLIFDPDSDGPSELRGSAFESIATLNLERVGKSAKEPAMPQKVAGGWLLANLVLPDRADHAAVLPDHEAVPSDHTAVLPDHTAVLSDHTAVLSDHEAVPSDHTARSGQRVAFARVGEGFELLHEVADEGQRRLSAPVGEFVLAERLDTGEVEGWSLSNGLERTFIEPARSSQIASDRALVFGRDGVLRARAFDGTERWHRRLDHGYLVDVGGAVLFYTQRESLLLDLESGEPRMELHSPYRLEVRVRGQQAVVLAGPRLEIVEGAGVSSIELSEELELVCLGPSGQVVLRDPTHRDRYLVYDREGPVGEFRSDGRVIEAHRHHGPYVLEEDLVRIGRLA